GGAPAAGGRGPVGVGPPRPPPVVVVVVGVVEEGVPPPKLPPPVNVPPPPVEPALLPPPVDTVGGVLGTPVAELENAMVETTRFFVSLYSLLGVLGLSRAGILRLICHPWSCGPGLWGMTGYRTTPKLLFGLRPHGWASCVRSNVQNIAPGFPELLPAAHW